MELFDSEVLHKAVKNETEKHIQNLLDKGFDIDEVDKNNKTALHIAVLEKRIEIVKLLLDNGASTNIKEKTSGMTPLHIAVKEKDLKIAGLLLQKGAKVNEVTKYNANALHLALKAQDEQMVKLTLKYGANIDAKKFGKSPLHLATEYANTNLAKVLLDQGINVNEISLDGQTALHIAVEMKDIDMVKLLINGGAKTDVKRFGKCPLYLAVDSSCIEIAEQVLSVSKRNSDNFVCSALELAFQKRNKEMVKMFINSDVDPDLVISDKRLLHLACECQWIDMVQLLLDKGADASAVTSDNVSPLHMALDKNCDELVKLLIDHKANVNTQQKRTGTTALHIATKNGNYEIVKLLLTHSAQPNVASNLNIRALHTAFDLRNYEIISCLIEHGADTNIPKYGKSPLELAVECKWLDLARELLVRGANVNTVGNENISLLLMAMKQKNLEMVELLLEFGADTNTPDPKTNMSPLQCAAYWRFEEVASLLIDKGASIDYATSDGTSVFHLALEKRCEHMVKLLLDHNVSLDIKRRHSTPLHLAAEYGWHEVAEILLSRGASIDEQNVYRVTPLGLAVERRDLQMATLFLDNGANVNYKWYGQTALHVASGKKRVDLVKLLLERGAVVNELRHQDGNHMTALHIAIRCGDEEMAKALIEAKASVKMRERKFNTSTMHLAAESGCREIIKILISMGAPVDVLDNLKNTPLILAAMNNKVQTAELLISRGAKVNHRNNMDHYTSLHYAVENQCCPMIRLLLREGVNIYEDKLSKSPFHIALEKNKRVMQILLDHDYQNRSRCEYITSFVNFSIANATNPEVRLVLLRHLARMDYKVSDAVFSRFNVDAMLKKHYEFCLVEIEKMKTHVFYEKVTVYEILTKTRKQVTALARNDSLIRSLREADHSTRYPIYSDLLIATMKEAREMSELVSAAEEMISILAYEVCRCQMPHLLNEQIINYLTNSDLHVLKSMYTEYIQKRQ